MGVELVERERYPWQYRAGRKGDISMAVGLVESYIQYTWE